MTTVVDFVTNDVFSGVIDFFVNIGWYALYGGLAVTGIALLFIVMKCVCNSLGHRWCSKSSKPTNELKVLEKLLDFQSRGQR